ncbi:hypothetical protein KHP34_26960, partial [Enterobacter hormaechei subsp. xiangfangensis]|uniref:hypothetical protein n=1 Tax=Enterobacter hormaechei TaxID=158836 RepID=UPI002874873B
INRTTELVKLAATVSPVRDVTASPEQRPESRLILPPEIVNAPANLPVINRTTELVKLAATVSPVRDVTASPEQRPESRLILPPGADVSALHAHGGYFPSDRILQER